LWEKNVAVAVTMSKEATITNPNHVPTPHHVTCQRRSAPIGCRSNSATRPSFIVLDPLNKGQQ
jgi:hypothetical protein